MSSTTIRCAVLGASEGNGHPFSFSAIVNGFSARAFSESGWPQIHAYLETRDPTELGGLGAQVTHAWTQDPALTRRLCRAALIEHAVEDLQELHGEVDAVLLTRDDADNHTAMAMPFLERGIPVFVDKPLAATHEDLAAFLPYVERGLLMSCSALRYARELDALRVSLPRAGDLLSVRGSAPKDWLRYGIHILDAALPLFAGARPLAVTALPAHHQALVVETSGGAILQIDCLGNSPNPLRLDVTSRSATWSVELLDNFSAFRRCLARFFEMVRTGEPPIPMQETASVIATLIAGEAAQKTPLSRVAVFDGSPR